VAQEQDLCGLPGLRTPDSRSQETVRVIIRKTNHRRMTGDHHGRTASRATLLVTAADEILDTYRFCAGPFGQDAGSTYRSAPPG